MPPAAMIDINLTKTKYEEEEYVQERAPHASTRQVVLVSSLCTSKCEDGAAAPPDRQLEVTYLSWEPAKQDCLL